MPDRPEFDPRRRALSYRGRITVLQQKCWQVLMVLVNSAPDVVTRAELIDSVWDGNYLTGEKGLTQAIWAIRAALSDDAREPRFLQTVPRVGYRWLRAEVVRSPNRRRIVRVAAALAGLVVVLFGLVSVDESGDDVRAHAHNTSSSGVATSAYLVGHDIHVEFAEGCRHILKNANRKPLGTPLLSDDGRNLAVTVREPDGCQLVTIDVATGELRRFGQCPDA